MRNLGYPSPGKGGPLQAVSLMEQWSIRVSTGDWTYIFGFCALSPVRSSNLDLSAMFASLGFNLLSDFSQVNLPLPLVFFNFLIFNFSPVTFSTLPVLLLFSRSVISDPLRPHGLQHTRLPCPPLSPRVWVGDAIQLSHPLSSPAPAFNLSQHEGLFQWVSSSHQMAKSTGASASASVLPMNIQGSFPLGLVWTPCCPRDSQESSPTPQFKSISSSALSLL